MKKVNYLNCMNHHTEKKEKKETNAALNVFFVTVSIAFMPFIIAAFVVLA